ncbi:MAG: RNA 3'-terminal phosphate cyclase [Anaerolineales bacterium]|jgi:RNA 3'-terminal phosphate cyclase (ATP)
MVRIDGSIGEGGGQILRTALSLSMITGIPFHINRIRANRRIPGLRPQHLAAINAARKISKAETQGVYLNSNSIFFSPKSIFSGSYSFNVGTAGSAILVLQTILAPLSMANSASSVSITGGTHVPWSPSYEYLKYTWTPFMHEIGLDFLLSLESAGFYPQGGGKIQAVIRPIRNPKPLDYVQRGKLLTISGFSAVANLDKSIAGRQKLRALNILYDSKLGIDNSKIKIKLNHLPSQFKGSTLFLNAAYENSRGGFFSLGKKGKLAEKVAEEAVNSLLKFHNDGGAVDWYMADQLLLPVSLIKDRSQFSTSKITNHFHTNREVVSFFLPVKIETSKQTNGNTHISVERLD